MATADKLNKLLQTKEAIRLALIEKGQNATVSMPFADYANMILGITTATGDIEIEIIDGEYTPGGKVITGIGDSIMYGRLDKGLERTSRPWLSTVGEALGMDSVVNLGINRSMIAESQYSGTNPIVNRLNEIPADSDYIILHGGINDFANGVPKGTMASRDKTTFYGALHNYYGAVKTAHPNSTIIVVTITRAPEVYYATGGVSQQEWANIQKEVANFYGLRIYDAYGLSNVKPGTADMADKLHFSQRDNDNFAQEVINFILAPAPLVNVLKAGTAKIGGATNTFVNNVRTAGDAIPVSTPFELRQWEAAWGGMNIPATDLKPNTVYTMVMEVELLNTVDQFWFELNENWWGGSFLFDGVPKTVTPSAGAYQLKPFLKTTGKTKIYYKWISGSTAPNSQLLGVRADNVPNDTKVMYHRFEIFEGDVNP